MKSWEQQEGESDTAFAHFLAFLSLGVERSIIRAYRLAHPESASTAVSGVWRAESITWRWRKRANDFDLSLFRESARELVATYGEAMQAIARKALAALTSKETEMRPRDWNEALHAFAVVRSLLPKETILAYMAEAENQGESKSAGKAGDPQLSDPPEESFLEELPEVDPPKDGLT